jgi:hypothetical protein
MISGREKLSHRPDRTQGVRPRAVNQQDIAHRNPPCVACLSTCSISAHNARRGTATLALQRPARLNARDKGGKRLAGGSFRTWRSYRRPASVRKPVVVRAVACSRDLVERGVPDRGRVRRRPMVGPEKRAIGHRSPTVVPSRASQASHELPPNARRNRACPGRSLPRSEPHRPHDWNRDEALVRCAPSALRLPSAVLYATKPTGTLPIGGIRACSARALARNLQTLPAAESRLPR